MVLLRSKQGVIWLNVMVATLEGGRFQDIHLSGINSMQKPFFLDGWNEYVITLFGVGTVFFGIGGVWFFAPLVLV